MAELAPRTWPSSLESWARFGVANDQVFPIHLDTAAAGAWGFDAPLGLGSQVWSYVHEALRAWFPEGDLVSLDGQFRSPWLLGHDLVVTGEVRAGGDEVLVVDVAAHAGAAAAVFTGVAEVRPLADG